MSHRSPVLATSRVARFLTPRGDASKFTIRAGFGVRLAARCAVAGKGAFLRVEDDPAIARAIGRLLAKSRPTHHVSRVAEAKAALEDATSWTGLVVDIGLPDGSGLDVLSAAREKWPTLPALVLTGSTQP